MLNVAQVLVCGTKSGFWVCVWTSFCKATLIFMQGMGQTPPELSRRVQASSYFYLQFGLFASCSVDWSGHGGLRRRNTVDAGPEHEEPDFEASVSDATSGVCADIFREVCDWMSDSQSEACQNPVACRTNIV